MKTPHARAAAAIRAELKAAGIKASVTSESFSMGNAVSIRLNNATKEIAAAVSAMVRKYQYGHFDGMTDCYEYSNRRDDLPQVKYVSVQNDNRLVAA